MSKIKFRIESSIYRDPKTGKVEIDLVPDRAGVEITDQQIIDAVAELLLWDNVSLEPLDDSEFDS